MRHASAKLFTQMGCKDVARFSGWAVLQPGWNDRYRRTDVDILPLIDPDAGQMDKLATRLAEVCGRARGDDTQPTILMCGGWWVGGNVVEPAQGGCVCHVG